MMSPAPRDRTRVPPSVRVPVFGSGIHSLVFGFAAALSLPCTSSVGSPGAAVFQLFFRVLAFRFQSADACYARAHGPPAHPTSLGHANSVVRYAVWCSQPRGLPAYRPTGLPAFVRDKESYYSCGRTYNCSNRFYKKLKNVSNRFRKDAKIGGLSFIFLSRSRLYA